MDGTCGSLRGNKKYVQNFDTRYSEYGDLVT